MKAATAFLCLMLAGCMQCMAYLTKCDQAFTFLSIVHQAQCNAPTKFA
jgi:hypothetical protein